jgi:hypothetical protein
MTATEFHIASALQPLHAGGVHIWSAERGELELPVSISEQPEDNMKSGASAPKRSVGIARGSKRLVGLYDRQHLKEALPRAHERHRD